MDINQTDGNKINSFWIAAYYNQAEIMKILFREGIFTGIKNEIGSNALHIAVKKCCKEAVKVLIDI